MSAQSAIHQNHSTEATVIDLRAACSAASDAMLVPLSQGT